MLSEFYKFFNSMNSSLDHSEIDIRNFKFTMALPSARAIRSYCTGLSHMAGIRFYP